jgi:hypothetical protein
MSTRRVQVPSEHLEKLGLHAGDAFHGKVEADGSATMSVAPAPNVALDSTSRKTWRERSNAWLAGSRRPEQVTDQEIDDARYLYLMEKHVWRHRPSNS